MNGRKTAWLRVLKITALLLPVALFVLLFPINDYDDAVRTRSFYLEEPNSLDVVVLGSSEDYAGYSPVLAYEEYGFTSYPYVFSANAFDLFEGQLDEVLRVQSPKLVVVDIGELRAIRGEESVDTVFREFIAGMPFCGHKVRLIQEFGDRDEILSYYLPFFVNHGKVPAAEMADYLKTNAMVRKRGYSLLKGTLTFTGSGENWDGPYVTPINTSGDTSTAELPPETVDLCRQVLAACGKYPDVSFLFVNFPHRITTEEAYREFQEINALGELITSSGWDFLNLDSMADEIGILPETDFYNNHHMNLHGQYRVTRFLCEYLTSRYELGGAISPENQAKWDDCVAYRRLYEQLFEEEFQSRDPEEFGTWMKEDAWLLTKLEEMRS